MNDNVYYWRNINIEKDLQIETIENNQNNNNNVWIKYKKTNQKLKIILEPMFAKTVRLYPYGNWIGEKEIPVITNQNRKWIQLSAKKLQDANYVLTLQSTLKTNKNNDTIDETKDNNNDAVQCLQWIEKLEVWFMEQCFYLENIWKKEKNKIKNIFKDECGAKQYNEKNALEKMIQDMYKNVKKEDKNNHKQYTFGIVQPIFQHYYGDLAKAINDNNKETKKYLSDEEKKIIGENSKYIKNIFPLYDRIGKIINTSDNTSIRNGDFVCACISPKKRSTKHANKIGMEFFINWIQLVDSKPKIIRKRKQRF